MQEAGIRTISDGFGKVSGSIIPIRKSGNRYLQDKQYWLERVKTLPGSPQIPILAAVNRGPNVFLRKEKAFTEQAWEELENVAERNGVTISVLLLTLYIHTLKRWSEEPEFTLNVTVMDRSDTDERHRAFCWRLYDQYTFQLRK